jgi:hypothetical protein
MAAPHASFPASWSAPTVHRLLATLCVATIATAVPAVAQSPATQQSKSPTATIPTLTREQRIAAAVLPLPAALRDGAGVIRLRNDGPAYDVIRPSTNGFMCYGPEGGERAFNAQCMNAAMMPLVARDAELARDHQRDQTNQIIEQEVAAGKLKIPDRPVASYLMRGPASAYDPVTGRAQAPIRTWQMIAAPRQTGATLGLLEAETPGTTIPYVMQPGTAWAHIMVVQP